jgi:hypothetical protein
MSRILLSLLLVVPAVCAQTGEPRKPHPYAPSIKELTEEEEKKLDTIVDRFILFDTGKLRGAEGQQAYRDFVKLGPDAIPALLRGLTRASMIQHSCPVTVIASKLERLLGASMDLRLLDFARDEMASAAGDGPHRVVVQNLRFGVTQRMNALKRAGVTALKPGQQFVKSMMTSALIEEAGKERGDRLRQVLAELGQRNGDEVLNTLGISAGSYDKEIQQIARTSLNTNLTRQKPDDLRKNLTHEKSEVRLAAVRVVRTKELRWGSELIERLSDDDATVREWAVTALIRMARGMDFGPPKNASKEQRDQAIQRWRAWWERQGSSKTR